MLSKFCYKRRKSIENLKLNELSANQISILNLKYSENEEQKVFRLSFKNKETEINLKKTSFDSRNLFHYGKDNQAIYHFLQFRENRFSHFSPSSLI